MLDPPLTTVTAPFQALPIFRSANCSISWPTAEEGDRDDHPRPRSSSGNRWPSECGRSVDAKRGRRRSRRSDAAARRHAFALGPRGISGIANRARPWIRFVTPPVLRHAFSFHVFRATTSPVPAASPKSNASARPARRRAGRRAGRNWPRASGDSRDPRNARHEPSRVSRFQPRARREPAAVGIALALPRLWDAFIDRGSARCRIARGRVAVAGALNGDCRPVVGRRLCEHLVVPAWDARGVLLLALPACLAALFHRERLLYRAVAGAARGNGARLPRRTRVQAVRSILATFGALLLPWLFGQRSGRCSPTSSTGRAGSDWARVCCW